jgi:hypothetical protein
VSHLVELTDRGTSASEMRANSQSRRLTRTHAGLNIAASWPTLPVFTPPVCERLSLAWLKTSVDAAKADPTAANLATAGAAVTRFTTAVQTLMRVWMAELKAETLAATAASVAAFR